MSKNVWPLIFLYSSLPWIGCLRTPAHQPPAIAPQKTPTPQENLISHLEGAWECPGHGGGKTKRALFGAGGRLTFENGLEYLNPGQWTLSPDRHELYITLPQADDEKLKIFKLYVGQGVQAFDHAKKEITYPFEMNTWMLNIAGWEYSKNESTTSEPLAEPVLR